jgi:hypothetical protein
LNPHSKGQNAHRFPSSVIDKAGIGNFVMECYAKGMSYREIGQAVWEKHSIKVSKMALSRYIIRDKKDFRPNVVGDSLQLVRDSIIQKNLDAYEDFNRVFDEIGTLIDISKLSSQEKSNLRKVLDIRKKQIVAKYTESRADLGLVFESLQKNEQGVTDLLIEFSTCLCPEDRRKVSKLVEDYEIRKGKRTVE